jgi:hypothetical protein
MPHIVWPTMAERTNTRVRTAAMPAGNNSVFLTLRDKHGGDTQHVARLTRANRRPEATPGRTIDPTDESWDNDA